MDWRWEKKTTLKDNTIIIIMLVATLAAVQVLL